VFLVGFLPTLVVGGWMLAAHEPGNYWLGRHVRSWSGDIGIDGLVDSLGLMIPAIAFGIGLVFGLAFDTTGPRIPRKMKPVPAAGAQPRPHQTTDPNGRVGEEDRRVRLGDEDAPEAQPAPEPAEPAKK
jgi:hypothetical protein